MNKKFMAIIALLALIFVIASMAMPGLATGGY